MGYRKNWELVHGKIPDGYHIHHINGKPTDHRLENLLLCTKQQHFLIHFLQWIVTGNIRDFKAAQLLAYHRYPSRRTMAQAARNRKSNPKRKTFNMKNCRLVMNTTTSELYRSISQAARDYGIPARTLTNQLTGISPNKTDLMIVQRKEELAYRKI